MCDNLGRFKDAFPASCVLGADGSVALFVTHQIGVGVADWEEMSPADPDWGRLLTYIPASEVAGIYARC